MSEHDERHDHDAKADQLERELDDMQAQADELGQEIEGAGEEWERRKADDGVPGAAGEPEQADGPEPEAEYPTKRDPEGGEPQGEGGGDGDGDTQPTSSAGTGELDFGRALAEDGGGDSDDEEKP